jgi:hypothetical protein
MIAPEPHLKACLWVLYFAVLEARVLGWKGMESDVTRDECEFLADLMDAVHNLPGLVLDWENCNQELLREMLANFDAKHQHQFHEMYRQAVAKHSH